MNGRGRVAFVGMFLFLVLGCTPEFLNLSFQRSGPRREQVVQGSLESVATTTQGVLRQSGLQVEAKPDGESVRLSSQTSNGQKFELVLTRQKTPQGESTRVRIEWEKDADEQLWFQLISVLAAVSAQ
jgi:hypothetical protein